MATPDGDDATITQLGDWKATEDDLLSTELDLEAPVADVFGRHTVHQSNESSARSDESIP